MELKNIQQSFVAAVTSGNESQDLLALIEPGGSLSCMEAVEVYVQDYKARMQEALGTNFEATWLVMGDDEFLEYAQEYIYANPSALTNLTNFGEGFIELLKTKDVSDEVIQMALFETEFWKCFHAPDASVIDLVKDDIENAAFDLSSIQLFEADIRLDVVWENREGGSDGLDDIDLYERSYFALYKAGSKVEVNKLSALVFGLLKELKEVGRISSLTPREYSPQEWAEAFLVLRFSEIK